MNIESQQLKTAIEAIRSDNKDKARELLGHIIRNNPESDKAWIYLAFAVDTPERSMECLQRAAQINPDNDKVHLLIEHLENKTRPLSSYVPCPECGTDNPSTQRYCIECGAALSGNPPPTKPVDSSKQTRNRYVVCPQCDVRNSGRERNCLNCGKSLSNLHGRLYKNSISRSDAECSNAVRNNNGSSKDQQPWYRSTSCLVLAFLFVNPIWAILVLTDENQPAWAKWVAGTSLMMQLVSIVYWVAILSQ